jgi:hypothetical protein
MSIPLLRSILLAAEGAHREIIASTHAIGTRRVRVPELGIPELLDILANAVRSDVLTSEDLAALIAGL